ncbi:MAG: hypothetical protein VX438_11340 [Planctomycetota bacterium]|jgi:hypothetical protein|nr:hypothetical protein [Planctomycetota bacterium]
MKKTLAQLQLVVIIALSCWQLGSDCAAQQPSALHPVAHPQTAETPLAINQRPDLFYNFYLHPAADSTAAAMYPAPMPVPARVGQSYYTYQPLLLHEHMYRHDRVYYRPHGTRDMFYVDPCNNQAEGQTYTKTSVIWTYGSNHLSPLPLKLPSFGYKLMKARGATCR